MSRDELLAWLKGEADLTEQIMDSSERSDYTRDQVKAYRAGQEAKPEMPEKLQRAMKAGRKGMKAAYLLTAVLCCLVMIGVLLFAVASLPRYGEENPRTMEVVSRYVEHGVEETGAVNIVAGMILDYRAFDTLGEAHVLFTALVCVTVLLRRDKKNMRTTYEDYYTIRRDRYFDTAGDSVMQRVGRVLLPCIFLYGFYILLNGQNGPGGGFSGGAVMGAGLILFAASFGFETVDRFFTPKTAVMITVISLGFYSFAKGYVFFTGANGLENHIPKGTPGEILSGGLILPLDIAVGLVVMCTMFGFYSLFKRGSIGHD